jgi:hypothetical protein
MCIVMFVKKAISVILKIGSLSYIDEGPAKLLPVYILMHIFGFCIFTYILNDLPSQKKQIRN